MDLQMLHARTGISRRKLRYCLDQKLVPELTVELANDEAGRPRRFGEDVGFAIVCAAALVELGLAHERIRTFLARLLAINLGGRGKPKRAIVAILQQDIPALAYLGNGDYVRLAVSGLDFDSGWRDPDDVARQIPGYEPRVTVTLDVGKIRDEVYHRLREA